MFRLFYVFFVIVVSATFGLLVFVYVFELRCFVAFGISRFVLLFDFAV